MPTRIIHRWNSLKPICPFVSTRYKAPAWHLSCTSWVKLRLGLGTRQVVDDKGHELSLSLSSCWVDRLVAQPAPR